VAADGQGTPPFNQARVVGGLLLLALVSALAIIDALSTQFTVDSIQFGLLLGSALLLLGVEAGRKLLG